MLRLKTGKEVSILRETNNLVIVRSTLCNGYDSKGDPIFNTYYLSKKHHKGSLFLDELCIL